jgi:PAS domain S-box-containing protein
VIKLDDYTIIDANKSLLDALKASRSEVIGRTCYEVTHHRKMRCGRPHDICPISEMLRTGKSVTAEHTHYDKNCKPYYVEVSATPMKDENGKITHAIHIAKDITERKRLEQEIKRHADHLEEEVEQKVRELRDSEERFRAISTTAKDAIVLFDEGEKISYWNPAAEKMFGYPREEALGKRFYDLIAPARYREASRKSFEDFMRIGDDRHVGRELVLNAARKDGSEFPVELSVSGFKLGEKMLSTGILRDITERKRTEALALENAMKLKNSERLAAIGMTAGMVGHDIRSPLQAITGEVFLAKRELKGLADGEVKESLNESIDVIAEQAAYINKIAADLQDYAKPLTPKLEEVDPKKVIEAVLHSINVPENIKVTYSVSPGLQKLVADEAYLRRIIQNLSINAIQAMPNGGKLTIHGAAQDSKAVISVEDTGGGIPEELKSKLFMPLVTTKAKGQGFGLAVIKRMTEALGGEVSYESQVGKGTKFSVTLPQN